MTLPNQVVAPEWEEPRVDIEAPAVELTPVVEGAAPTTVDAAPIAPEVDAPNWQEQFEHSQTALTTLQSNMNTLKSNHDRSAFQMQREFQQREEVMGERLAELEMKDLDDDQKAVYLQKRELTRIENQSGQLDQREFQLSQRESMLAWDDYFVSRIGIDPATLKRDEGFEVFHTGGWQGVEVLVTDLRARNTQLEEFITASKLQAPGAPKVVLPPVGKKPPKVQTKAPGPAPAKRRMADVPAAEREALYAAFEAGDIEAKDMPI